MRNLGKTIWPACIDPIFAVT